MYLNLGWVGKNIGNSYQGKEKLGENREILHRSPMSP